MFEKFALEDQRKLASQKRSKREENMARKVADEAQKAESMETDGTAGDQAVEDQAIEEKSVENGTTEPVSA